MSLFKKQRPSSILGLALDGNRLEGVVVRRAGGGLQVKESVSVPLALSPLGGDPLLVGREIRNHLDQAGVRERSCIVCLPASWILTVQTQVPELPEADVASFLQLEAERGFTSGHENLFIVNSQSRAAGGERYATLIAIPRNHLDTLEKALRAAQLKPLSFVLGLAALENGGREGAPGAFTIAVGSNSAELGAVSGGGLVALRSLDGAVETSGPQKRIDAELIAREIRITLGQLPAALAPDVRFVKVFARGELARQFMADFTPRIQNMGLRLETMDRASGAEFSSPLPTELALSPALAAGANFVRGEDSGPELLPPKISWFQAQMAKRAVTKKLGWVGVAGAGVVLCIAGLFVYQEFQLLNWRGQKSALDRQATGVKAAQVQINRYNAWFDESARSLNIMAAMARAFPLNGSQATAKSVRISNLSDVSVAGTAQSSAQIVQIVEALAKTPGVKAGSASAPSQSGTPPAVQFTLNFTWEGVFNGE
jgi:hypothetical protein